MFNFPKATPPAEKRPDISDLLHDLLKRMVEDMEQNAEDEATRLSAGITLRVTKMNDVTDTLRKYALVRGKLPVEALVAVRNLLDKMLSEADALIKRYPIHEKTETEKI